WMEHGEAARLAAIAAYNAEDCRATRALRDWLVAQRPAEVATLIPVEAPEAKPSPYAALRQQLVDGAEPGSRPWIAGELLEYHRREEKPVWWAFFERCERMTLEDLIEEDTESIGGLEPIGGPRPSKRSIEQTFRFPPQQYKLAVGDTPADPVTRKDAGLIVA